MEFKAGQACKTGKRRTGKCMIEGTGRDIIGITIGGDKKSDMQDR